MKKVLSLILVLAALACMMVACNTGNGGNDNNQPEVDPNAKSEGSMTHEEYVAAALNSPVVIEGFVQGKQSWWDNKASIYLQDGTGGYFAYEMTCTEEQYNKLTVGTKIKVTGYKAEWAGEVEVDSGCTFEIIEGVNWVAAPTDVTSLLGTEELIAKQNMLVSCKGMTVVSIEFKGGAAGDDIYVNLTKDGKEYSFCVERYLTGPDTDNYKAVSALKAGDVIDLEGFLYWWDAPNTHITKITVK